MKWLDFLHSKAGKLVITTQNALIASVGVGFVAATTFYNMGAEQAEQELAVRPLGAISNTYSYDGLQGDSRHGLTSINVSAGDRRLASAEDRARLEGRKGDFGLGAADNVGRRVQGALALGPAAQTGETDGLGMGANEAVEVPATGGNGTPGVTGPRRSPRLTSGQTDTSGRETGGGAGNGARLAPASITRSGGNSFNSTSGPAGGGTTGAGPRLTRGGTPGGDGYQFSGNMPGGTNAITALAGAQAGNGGGAHFMPGSRNARVHRGKPTFNAGSDLKDISKRSADAAANRFRSTNEGSRAFLAASQNSAGMELTTGEDLTEQGSADFTAPEDTQAKNIGNWADNVDTTAQQRDEDRNGILNWMLVTLGATLVILPLAAYLLQLGNTGFWGVVFKVLGYALLVALAAIAGYLIYIAGKFQHTYDAIVLPVLMYLVGGAVITGAVLTALKPAMVWGWIAKSWSGILKTIGSTIGIPVATTAVTSAINSDK